MTLKPFVERRALDRINAVVDDAHYGRLLKRAAMIEDQDRADDAGASRR